MQVMNYYLFGKSGLRVSELCLGTMTFGDEWGWGSPKEEAKAIYDAFREAGGNFIDTANFYTDGTSESFLGEFMQGHREEIVLATKYTLAPAGNNPNAAGNHRKSMVQSVEASLKRLKTDYIDVYWSHIWDQLTPVEEVMRAFDDLVRAGKVLYIGVSDAPAWVIAQANMLAGLRGWTAYTGMQIEYSLLERTVERELIPLAENQDMAVTAWSPLKSGLLTGKYLSREEGGAGGAGAEARLNHDMMKDFGKTGERGIKTVQETVAVAGELGVSPAQVALAWLRTRPVKVIPIIGARKMPQLEDNLRSLEVKLSPEHVRRLDDASAIEMGFPHDFFEAEMPRTVAHGGMREKILA